MKFPVCSSVPVNVGKAEGDRRTYYVFESKADYLVVAPNSAGGFNLNVVDSKVPDAVTTGFKGKKLTAARLKRSSRRPGLFRGPFFSARTRKLKQRKGKAMVFKIGRS